MRMRRKPWARPELDASSVYIKNPLDYYNKWSSVFTADKPICMELGCGKGGYISQKAFRHPEKNFLAFDIKSEMLGLAKRNIEKVYGSTDCPNVRIAAVNIERIHLVMGPDDQVEEIYINFCNPWPRTKHKKRRLTYTKQLEQYKIFLKKDGKVYFKTDDDRLFADSIDYFKDCGFDIEFITYDMASNPWEENIETEHEKMFSREGIKIKGLIAVNAHPEKCGFVPKAKEDENQEEDRQEE